MIDNETREYAEELMAVEPKILYFGTPVVLVSSVNEDGSFNLAPMSSCWTLGWTAVLGLGTNGKTFENLQQRPDCVLNVPSPELWVAVEKLAPLTGKSPVPEMKAAKFRYEPNKFGAAGLTPVSSERVASPRVRECPLQLEARVRSIHMLEEMEISSSDGAAAVEVEILRCHVHRSYIVGGNHIDPAKWSPLIYNFRHYFGLGREMGKTFRAEV